MAGDLTDLIMEVVQESEEYKINQEDKKKKVIKH